MFYSVYDRGQVRMGRWARIDLDLHANRGFVGIIIGYTDNYLVKLSDGEKTSHAMPRHLTVLSRLDGQKQALQRTLDQLEARRRQDQEKATARVAELKGETHAETIANLARRIVELEKR